MKLRRRLTFRLNERSDVAEATISEVLRRRLTRVAMLSVAAEAKVGHPQAIIKKTRPKVGSLALQTLTRRVYWFVAPYQTLKANKLCS